MMEQSLIVFTYKYHFGGFGDFWRSFLSFLSFAKRNHIQLCVDISENPHFQGCFSLPDSNISSTPVVTMESSEGIVEQDKYKDLSTTMIENPAVYKITSNEVGFENVENMRTVWDDFIRIVQPSNKVVFVVHEMEQKHNLKFQSYTSVHIRCGDAHMEENKTSTSSSTYFDSRISNRETFHRDIHHAIQSQNITGPIVFHTDSEKLKSEMKKHFPEEYILLDVSIQHVANNIGENNDTSYISTAAEFFLMSRASKILSLFHYSGFAHMASIVGKTPFHVNYKDRHLDILDMGNIHYF